MCDCNLAAIPANCESNAPGAKPLLRVTCPDQIESIDAASAHEVAGITMVTTPAAGLFFEWGTSRKDIEFECDQDENGQWVLNAKYFIAKQSAAKSDILNNLGEDNSIIIAEDLNSNKRLIGALDNPADIKVKEVLYPKNGYEVRINWTSAFSPFYYTGAIAV